jgi:hypothetical protein
MKTLFFALLFCLVPALAYAHPGHGTTDPSSWQHYLTEPVHVATLATAMALVVTTVLEIRRRRAIAKL